MSRKGQTLPSDSRTANDCSRRVSGSPSVGSRAAAERRKRPLSAAPTLPTRVSGRHVNERPSRLPTLSVFRISAETAWRLKCFPATYASAVIFLRSVVSVRRSQQRRFRYVRMGYDDLRDNQRRADRAGAGGSMPLSGERVPCVRRTSSSGPGVSRNPFA